MWILCLSMPNISLKTNGPKTHFVRTCCWLFFSTLPATLVGSKTKPIQTQQGIHSLQHYNGKRLQVFLQNDDARPSHILESKTCTSYLSYTMHLLIMIALIHNEWCQPTMISRVWFPYKMTSCINNTMLSYLVKKGLGAWHVFLTQSPRKPIL